jgi:hypothetical protein
MHLSGVAFMLTVLTEVGASPSEMDLYVNNVNRSGFLLPTWDSNLKTRARETVKNINIKEDF